MNAIAPAKIVRPNHNNSGTQTVHLTKPDSLPVEEVKKMEGLETIKPTESIMDIKADASARTEPVARKNVIEETSAPVATYLMEPVSKLLECHHRHKTVLCKSQYF